MLMLKTIMFLQMLIANEVLGASVLVANEDGDIGGGGDRSSDG